MMTKKALKDIARGFGCASLISIEADAKTVKGQKKGFVTGVMYMMPDNVLCPMSKTAGCHEGCLVAAGRAAFDKHIPKIRAGRTQFFHENREAFLELLIRWEIPRVIRKAKRENMTPAVRLNGTSDIDWSTVKFDGKSVFEHFPEIQFYDYTKSPAIIRKAGKVKNWHITASYSEASAKYASMITAAADKHGANLAVVFRDENMPSEFMGRPVINGDETDLRFLDDSGVIVGLKAKGPAKKDDSGFVVDAGKYDNVIMAA